MELIINYLCAGRVEFDHRKSCINLVIGKFSDINNIVIPFFNKYPILGIKTLDYMDWCKVANLINLGDHLTKEGLKEIQQIKTGMNKGRKIE